MKFFKVIILFVLVILLSPTLNGGQSYRDVSPVENFIEESQTTFCDIEVEIDDELVLTNSSRRGKSQSEGNLVFFKNCPFSVTDFSVKNDVKRATQFFDIYLTQNEEISFIHRFQLF